MKDNLLKTLKKKTHNLLRNANEFKILKVVNLPGQIQTTTPLILD